MDFRLKGSSGRWQSALACLGVPLIRLHSFANTVSVMNDRHSCERSRPQGAIVLEATREIQFFDAHTGRAPQLPQRPRYDGPTLAHAGAEFNDRLMAQRTLKRYDSILAARQPAAEPQPDDGCKRVDRPAPISTVKRSMLGG
jgi:hypothetical protein